MKIRFSAKRGAWALVCLLGTAGYAQSSERDAVADFPDALKAAFLGLEVWQWLALATLLAGSMFLGPVLAWLIGLGARSKRWTQKSEEAIKRFRKARRSLGYLISLGLVSLGVPSLLLEDHLETGIQYVLLVLKIAAATLFCSSLWEVVCDWFVSKADKASRKERNLILPFIRRCGQVAIVIFGAVAAAAAMGFNVAGMIAGLGIGGLVLALAAKNSVENVFGSLTVVLDMPFVLGDWVKVGSEEGVVEEINLRSTRLRTAQDSMIVIPNSNLITASIENLGAKRFRRIQINLNVNSTASSATIQEFIESLKHMAESSDAVVKGSAEVSLFDITATGSVIQFSCLTEAADRHLALEKRQIVLLGILDQAEAHGIAFGPTAPPALGQALPSQPKLETPSDKGPISP